MKKIYLFLLFLVLNSYTSFGQFIFDDRFFCENYGNFEPFEYNEQNGTFIFNLNKSKSEIVIKGKRLKSIEKWIH